MQPGPHPRNRILLLEDCADDAELLAITLESAGLDADVQRVVCERDFIEALATFVPDVVVSDSNLPGFSGMQALDLVRTSMPGTPFVFLTGNEADHPEANAARQLANGYLSKDDMGAVPGLLASLFAERA